MKRTLLLLSLYAGCVSSAPSRDALVVSGAALALGMSREEVTQALPDKVVLSQVQGTDHWLIARKDGRLPVPGSVTFHGGRLTVISRTRGTFGQNDGIQVADALRSAVSDVLASGERVSAVRTDSHSTGDQYFRSVTLQFSTRTINVGISSGGNLMPQIMIEESIGWPKIDVDR